MKDFQAGRLIEELVEDYRLLRHRNIEPDERHLDFGTLGQLHCRERTILAGLDWWRAIE